MRHRCLGATLVVTCTYKRHWQTLITSLWARSSHPEYKSVIRAGLPKKAALRHEGANSRPLTLAASLPRCPGLQGSRALGLQGLQEHGTRLGFPFRVPPDP